MAQLVEALSRKVKGCQLHPTSLGVFRRQPNDVSLSHWYFSLSPIPLSLKVVKKMSLGEDILKQNMCSHLWCFHNQIQSRDGVTGLSHSWQPPARTVLHGFCEPGWPSAQETKPRWASGITKVI